MNNILKAWNAGLVRRWHTQPELCDTIDYDSGHQQRCTIMLLLFWPDAPRWLIIMTLIHDQGECDAGDMAGPAKAKHPEVRGILQLIEDDSIREQGFPLDHLLLTPEEQRKIKFVDYLDSYVWMLRNKSQLSRKVQWAQQLDHLFTEAEALGVEQEFADFIAAANSFYIV